ncbi:hypothetical protein GCM10007094_08390 [Pseudovibrio japonicus]|uniref:Mannan-binding protein domain-containing protein n=1 Tax=Pseudovibrio japonicus TaxID=366534 RepID=A0ABQ3E4W9_9HYPH|nr:mannan-binding lectin [Pseudovibrio japonicus]GHB22545.1 hypothetical protein GCM10007094_08390 [Pseudovibrio japonicus]
MYAGQAFAYTEDVEAGPIWNQLDAEEKCPQVAAEAGGTWNGQWTTTIPGEMSVCGVDFPDDPDD